MKPSLHLHFLGDFLLLLGDTPVTTVTIPRVQSLLAYLVLHRTAPQVRSHLAFLLWPESSEVQARANLRKVLYQLQHTLPFANAFLAVEKHHLQWQPGSDASWTLDAVDFEQALAQAEQAAKTQQGAERRQALERAVDYYQGDLLPGCYDEWLLSERERLRQLYLQALQQLIVLYEQERDYDAAIKKAHHLLRFDPLHEVVYQQLMRLYALQGNRAAALRLYHTCALVLERELAAEPSEATRQIYASLVQEDTSFRPQIGSLSPRSLGTPLIGRNQEWRQFQVTWHRMASGHPHMILLAGEAGIGKTRLAEEMVIWASRQGMTTASAHCYAAEGRLPYAPVSEWLRAETMQTGLSNLAEERLTEIARLMPDLLTSRPDLPRPTPMREVWQRHQFFEALARGLLSACQPIVLLLEDLQWCDGETLQWLHYLLRFDPRACLLLLGTVRLEETPLEHPLSEFLRSLRHENIVTEIELGPLETAEVASLVKHLASHLFDHAMVARLNHETEGNPLFIVEMLRAEAVEFYGNKHHPLDDSYPPVRHLPTKIQTVLAARLAQLSPLARELTNIAAVIGREFSFSVLARASSKDEETLVRGLDELWHRHLIRERDGDAYDFCHDKLREQTYATLSIGSQRLLHRRVAEALEAVYANTSDAVSRQIAVHYARAGLPWKAISWYQRAGEVARCIAANAEAIAAYQQAVTLLEANGGTSVLQDWQWERAAEVYTNLGDILHITGHAQQARSVYEQGRRYIPAQAFLWRACIQRKIAHTWNHPSTLELLLRGYKEAERLLEQVPDRSSRRWHQEWLAIQLDQLLPLQLHRLSVQQMSHLLKKIQPAVVQHGTPAQQTQFFLTAAAHSIACGGYRASEETVDQFRTALAMAQQTKNTSLIGFAHFGLGHALFLAGCLDRAEEQMHMAMRVGEETGSVFLLERCLSFLPFIFRQRGQVEEVRGVITHALAMPEMSLTSLLMAHRAWLAMRDGEVDKAESYSKVVLEEWQHQQPTNPHQWAALWPLIGALLVQQQLSEAMHYVQVLLDVGQQPSSEPLATFLQSTRQAWDAGQKMIAHERLQQVLPLARELGYF